MLVLSRYEGESIKIGPDIVVSVERVQRGLVRIGIIAPSNVAIVRSELPPLPTKPEGKGNADHQGQAE